MGLDILICFDNNEKIYSKEYYQENVEHFQQHSLSRTFCNFMCKKDAVSGEPELDQIGRITSVNISSIYEMENYGHGEELEFFLESAQTEEQRQNILRLNEASKNKLKGNIDKVLETIRKLRGKLSTIQNLPDLLYDNGFDSLENKTYFRDFNNEKEANYNEDNFGRDLRNFEKFLVYAKTNGSITTYFNYG